MNISNRKAAPTAPMDLSVASYNVHRCIGRDGRHDPRRIAQVIARLDPDIIALQEVESRFGRAGDVHQLNYLAGATGLTAIPGPTILRPESHYGNALLTRCPVLTVRRINLSVLPDREPRGALDVTLALRGQPLRVIATHLGLRAGERREQVKRLLAGLGPATHDPLIVLGDINEWAPLSRPLRWLGAYLGKAPAPRTFPAQFPLFALDRLWVRPRNALRSIKALRIPLTCMASDHLPLQARIRIAALNTGANGSGG